MQAHSQLQEFLEAYHPSIQELFWLLRSFILSQDEQANELIWDNYNALAIAYSRSEQLKDAYCHVALYTKHINFGLNRGTELRQDILPLEGTGKLIRHIKINKIEDINITAFSTLITEGRTLSITRNPKLASLASVPSSIIMSIAKNSNRPKR